VHASCLITQERCVYTGAGTIAGGVPLGFFWYVNTPLYTTTGQFWPIPGGVFGYYELFWGLQGWFGWF